MYIFSGLLIGLLIMINIGFVSNNLKDMETRYDLLSREINKDFSSKQQEFNDRINQTYNSIDETNSYNPVKFDNIDDVIKDFDKKIGVSNDVSLMKAEIPFTKPIVDINPDGTVVVGGSNGSGGNGGTASVINGDKAVENMIADVLFLEGAAIKFFQEKGHWPTVGNVLTQELLDDKLEEKFLTSYGYSLISLKPYNVSVDILQYLHTSLNNPLNQYYILTSGDFEGYIFYYKVVKDNNGKEYIGI